MLERHLESTFCDDIRQEVTGKFLYIGVYGTELYVPSVPITLPKLCIAIKALSFSHEAFKSLRLRVLFNDNVLAEITQDFSQLNGTELSPTENPNKVFTFNTIVTLSPFQIDGEGSVRVRGLDEDGREYAALGLRICVIPQEPGTDIDLEPA